MIIVYAAPRDLDDAFAGIWREVSSDGWALIEGTPKVLAIVAARGWRHEPAPG